jgi:hypothetical protein
VVAAALAAAEPGRAEDALGARSTPATAAPSLADFERALDRLGEWVHVRPWGRGWRPAGVGPEWRPYFHGSWTYSEDGWFWVSAEPWGWATYHYGRWLFDGSFGWVWVPGRVWAPAWVTWRWSEDAVGWAPLPPSGPPLVAFWTFVPRRRLLGERMEDAALPPGQVPALLVRTRPATAATAAAWRAVPRPVTARAGS